MRVLHVMATGETSGGGTHLLGLLPALRELGVDIRAAVGSDGPLAERLRERGVEAEHVELMRARLDPAAPARLAHVIQTSGAELVHLHGTRAAFFGALARAHSPALPPTIYSVHGLSYRKERTRGRRAVFLAAEAFACRLAAHVIAVARADLEELRARGFAAPERSSHVPNAVDTDRFTPGDVAHARTRLGLAPGALVVGTVARLVDGKGVADLVAAVARASAPVRLVVVGDGPERVTLEAQARASGVTAHFLGRRDDVPDVLRALDVFVLASRWEGEPVALLEALATGLPCIGTRTSGALDVLAGFEGGRLVPIADVEALRAAIDGLARIPDAERRHLGASGRARVLGRGPAVLAARVAEIYRVLDTRHASS